MPDKRILTLEAVSFGYAKRPLLFSGLGFTLRQGEQIGLYGPNGCGKTTLLRLMMGLETPQSGHILFHGHSIREDRTLYRLRCGVGFVLQNSDDQLFSPTVLEDVAFGPLNLGLPRNEARDKAMKTLADTGLAALAEKPIHHLSSGEKKRVAIASVLSMQPEALLLDEPTAFLDAPSREKIIHLLKQQDTARIVVSHDRDFLEQTTSVIMRIEGNRLV